jgi:predicted nucleic acid-binding protein
MARTYLDTSIWMDFFEKRDEVHLAKTTLAQQLISKIIREGSIIVYADIIQNELVKQGYSHEELGRLFVPLAKITEYVDATEKEFGRSKDLAAKRDIPRLDSFHALIARDNHAILATRDRHFAMLTDIVPSKKPEDII